MPPLTMQLRVRSNELPKSDAVLEGFRALDEDKLAREHGESEENEVGEVGRVREAVSTWAFRRQAASVVVVVVVVVNSVGVFMTSL